MKKFLFLICLTPSILWAQNNIEGTIKGTDGTIPGATVQLLKTSHATITNEKGEFAFDNLPNGAYEMEVRFIGYKPHVEKVSLPGTTSVEIALQESTLTIDEVVVTGTMNPTFVSQSPVKIDVVTSTHLNTYLPTAASSLVEGISLVNGIQEVTACGVCFTNSISINGLPGPYTAVLMDGSPIYGNLASVYGLNGIPSMIIDRFEVIKGPSSTLYGSEAVAGVINIITKDPSRQPLFSIDLMGTSHMESFGNLAFAPKIGKHSGFIGANFAYINDFDDRNADGFSDNVNMDRISLFSKWNIHRKSGKQFTFSAKYYYEDRRNGVQEFLNDRNYRQLRGSSSVYGESIYTNRFEAFGTYELPYIANLKLDFSASTHSQDSYYGADYYQASQNIVFTNLVWNNTFGNHQVISGLTNRLQTYDDNTVATTEGADRQYIPGVFAQDEWALTDRFSLLGGIRLDHYRDHGPILAPRLNAKLKADKWTTLRANFGTGFRIVNLFTEDHAFVTGQREVVIAEKLNPEESFNYSMNINHVYTLWNGQGMVDIDAYYTYFSNKITPNYDQPEQITYENSDGHATSKGIGINIQHQLNIPLSANLGMNFQDVSETENGRKRAIEFSPRWSGVFTANYNHRPWKTTVAYTARLTGPMALPEVYDLNEQGEPQPNPRPTLSEAFSIHNLQVQKELNNGFSVYGGIQNIFDYIQPWSPLVGFNDPGANPGFSDNFDTAYAYSPIHGREFYLGITWNMTRK
ncbi:TonB-dependent receptor [Marinoscillum furvescens]|uniref:Outer membrane receptor for ferrienterochelin and colicins n=1 Tax=Marinoscillum furvescens DSM 4134 TaxID=1122208 RepID=A0A3D9L7M5_MARFU|nr:TonB-dependent receptor [Marinoscillum furvescens]REE02082.1 outer membrane receptor for ferrienterochelin and colicins [Marinoscillum furvescens DSM 4134]